MQWAASIAFPQGIARRLSTSEPPKAAFGLADLTTSAPAADTAAAAGSPREARRGRVVWSERAAEREGNQIQNDGRVRKRRWRCVGWRSARSRDYKQRSRFGQRQSWKVALLLARLPGAGAPIRAGSGELSVNSSVRSQIRTVAFCPGYSASLAFDGESGGRSFEFRRWHVRRDMREINEEKTQIRMECLPEVASRQVRWQVSR